MLELDANMVEKYGITESHELSSDDKTSYVEEQISQIKTMLWRSRVDIMVMSASVPTTEDEIAEKITRIRGLEKEMSKYVDALTSFNKILDEL